MKMKVKENSISYCPNCGSIRMHLQSIKSRNTYSDGAADFYCEACGASGIIDLDGTSVENE